MPTWKLGYEANCWGALGGDGRGVTSIKDLFYRTFGDAATAAAEIGEAGFQGWSSSTATSSTSPTIFPP